MRAVNEIYLKAFSKRDLIDKATNISQLMVINQKWSTFINYARIDYEWPSFDKYDDKCRIYPDSAVPAKARNIDVFSIFEV